ncbi:MAG: HD domain-containing protein [Lentisphaeria bacterium]|nr:HD domain-containing protein [Lentisphaeria bacterium]MBQ7404700.1 HD domain-containing protein [Lentisphaeria bacterium]
MNDELFQRVFERVRAIFSGVRGGHDLDHTMRVYVNACKIAKMELPAEDEASFRIVRYAALLHDCARPEEDSGKGSICHAALGRVKSVEILRELGCEEESFLYAVGECVGKHRYRGKDTPVTLAEKIVYDADKLDSIGAVGIARTFHFASHVGARIHNTEKQALEGAEYGPEDTGYREYLVKLRNVPQRMLTASGKALAVERGSFMKTFFDELNAETEEVFRFTGELE